jgi:hypothetical protein
MSARHLRDGDIQRRDSGHELLSVRSQIEGSGTVLVQNHPPLQVFGAGQNPLGLFEQLDGVMDGFDALFALGKPHCAPQADHGKQRDKANPANDAEGKTCSLSQ